MEIIKQQLNVKEIKLGKGQEKVSFDTRMTPELESEGYTRELSRQVQDFRKKLGLKKENMVETYIITDDKFRKILEMQKNFLKERTNSKKLEFVTTGKERFKNIIGFTIRDKKGDIAVVY
jgi:isoleucyl-tRNA synthetase